MSIDSPGFFISGGFLRKQSLYDNAQSNQRQEYRKQRRLQAKETRQTDKNSNNSQNNRETARGNVVDVSNTVKDKHDESCADQPCALRNNSPGTSKRVPINNRKKPQLLSSRRLFRATFVEAELLKN
jgi:hypothetical protein